MKYDALIYDCDFENIFDADDPAHQNMIRIDGLSQPETDDLCDIMTQHGVSICLLPYKE